MLFSIYLSFLKIGAFAFGGGYAILPYMSQILVNNNHWLTTSQFNTYIGLVQIAPGPVTVNLSTYIGFKLYGILGALFAILGISTIPIILVILASIFFNKFKNSLLWNNALQKIKPVLLALIFSAFISTSHIYTTNWREIFIALLAVYLSIYKKKSVLLIILVSSILSLILYQI